MMLAFTLLPSCEAEGLNIEKISQLLQHPP